jgi:hypothetical protein
MPSGGAKEKQTTLNFSPSSQPDNTRNSQLHNNNNASDTIENTGDETISNRQKRNRTEFEQSDNNDRNHLQIPDVRASESESSLFSSDSNMTVIDRHVNIGVGPIESASVNNINIDTNLVTDEKHKPRIIRLERMRDKADRYSSHIEFLKDCHKTKVIPKGLRIDVEPSIGNNDEEFCNQWFSRLEDFSLTLISDIITYSENIKTSTASKIEEETKFLRENLNGEDFQEFQEIMDRSSEKRRKRLSMTKRKKYHFLRYNRPEREHPERQPSGRNTRRQEDSSDRESNRRRSDNSDDRRSDRHHGNHRNHGDNTNDFRPRHGDGHQEEHRDSCSGDRASGNRHRAIHFQGDDSTNHRDNDHGHDHHNNNRNRASHRDRDITNNRRDNGFGNDRQSRNNDLDRQVDSRQSQRDEPSSISRRTTYRDILNNRRSRPSSRTSSNTNLHRQASRTSSINNLRRESNAALSKRNSDHDNQQHARNSESSEIATLRKKLAEYERNANTSASKNATLPSEEGTSSSKKATTQEMLEYITTTMQSLEGFRRQLSS